LSNQVKVLFASGSPEAIALVIGRMRDILPHLPLVLVSEFAPPVQDAEWIPYHVKRSWRENLELVRAQLADRSVRISAVILEPRTPFWPMRRAGFALAPKYFLAFNENGGHFMLRPRSIGNIFGHFAWRAKNFFRWQFGERGWIRKQLDRIRHPSRLRQPIYYRLALGRARRAAPRKLMNHAPGPARPSGISVIIPSRNGWELLESCLPGIEGADEIIVVDNGSTEDSSAKLRTQFPKIVIESSSQPLSFSRAINRGLARAKYSHICLLNNDMLVEPGFLAALRAAFDKVPGLFCASAQIFFPEGQRREETGKTVMPPRNGLTDFPLRCDIPLEGEDLTYVLYGSGGCSLFDARKLAILGGFDEAYDPAYVEDLDVGVRAWQRGWPAVYCAHARVLHFHRTTTSKYFTPEQLNRALEYNWIRFLARSIGPRERFERMWTENAVRLNLLKDVDALQFASRQQTSFVDQARDDFFDLANGDVAVFPGNLAAGEADIAPRNKPRVLVASPYLPFPLAHGAAVRIYNLMRRTARDFDQILVAFVEESQPVPPELRDIFCEIVTVRRHGSHAIASTPRPDTVEEFDSPAFHAALRQTIAKWQPAIAQLEFTQMAIYASDCAPAKTILVEHDITFDLYAQMLAQKEDWETRRQYERWLTFEHDAWNRVDRVVVMSGKDRGVVDGSIVIANGVDLERFKPSSRDPEPRRLLFIGSFAHHPNVLAMQFFLREVFPKLDNVTLHVIAGKRHETFWDLKHENVEVEGFVSDVRPAYERAAIVIAPLIASAGTNIKIMEAMAMGKAIVSTEAGIHGLELERGLDVVAAENATDFASAIQDLLQDAHKRHAIELHARATAERIYGWDAIAQQQAELYRSLSNH